MEDHSTSAYPCEIIVGDHDQIDNRITENSINHDLSGISGRFSSEECLQNIVPTKKFDKGVYSSVYHLKEGFVMKVSNSSFSKMLDVANELYILTQISHSCIIKSSYVTNCDDSIVYVLPICEATLKTFIPSNAIHKEMIMKQLVSGIQFLHSRNMLHLDIALRNILINRRGDSYEIKICDFSLTCIYCEGTLTSESPRISSDYRPYENLQGSKVYSRKSDIWSLGIVFSSILSEKKFFKLGTLPFRVQTESDYDLAVRFEIEKRFLWKKWPGISDPRITKMLSLDIEQRPDIDEVCQMFEAPFDNILSLPKQKEKTFQFWRDITSIFSDFKEEEIFQIEHLYSKVDNYHQVKEIVLTHREQLDFFICCCGIIKSLFKTSLDFYTRESQKYFKSVKKIYYITGGNLIKY